MRLANILDSVSAIFPRSTDDGEKKKRLTQPPVTAPPVVAPDGSTPNPDRFKQFSPQYGGPDAPAIVPMADNRGGQPVSPTVVTPAPVIAPTVDAPQDMFTGGSGIAPSSTAIVPFDAPATPTVSDPNPNISIIGPDRPEVQVNPFSSIPGATTAHPEDEKDPYLRQQRIAAEGVSKNGFWKRLGLGALQGFATGGIGGALFGGILRGAVPSIDQNLKKQQYLAKTQQEIGQDQQQRKFEDDRVKAQGDAYLKALEAQGTMLTNQGKVIKNAQDMTELQKSQIVNDPLWVANVAPTKNLTAQQAAYFNERYGTNLSPAAWQDFVEKTDPGTGKSMIRPTTDPRYSVNPTLSPDATVPPVAVTANGIPVTVKGNQVLGAVAAEATANANRVDGTNRFNANNTLEAAKTNIAARSKYNSEVLQMQTEILKNLNLTDAQRSVYDGVVNRRANTYTLLQNALNKLQAMPAPHDPDTYKQYKDAQNKVDEYQKGFDGLEKEVYEAVGKINGGDHAVDRMKELQKGLEKPGTVNYSPIAPVQTQTIQPVKPPAGAVKGTKNNRVGTTLSYEEQMRRIRGH